MRRFTTTEGPGHPYRVSPDAVTREDAGDTGPAIERLACFENAYEAIERERDKAEAELSKLRAAGKQKTVQFKQLLAQKITHANILSLFAIHGIKA